MIKLTATAFKDVIKRDRCSFPLNTKPILNIATQNSQCTRVSIVGSMKELFAKFLKADVGRSVDDWENWYLNNGGTQKIQDATDKLFDYLNKMPLDHTVFTREVAENYILDLVINKTHYGMSGEYYAVLATAKYFGLDYSFSSAEEERQGIDAWIGDKPVQVKPHDSVIKHHVRNGADIDKTLVITYEAKEDRCFIHNPEFMNNLFSI
jgi:hypothetical protein